MKFSKHPLTNDSLRTVAVMCGGVAFLIALAVWIAPNSDIFISSAHPVEQSLAASGVPDSLNTSLPPVDDSGVLAQGAPGGGHTCDPEPPYVITGPATSITASNARLNASGSSGCQAYSGVIKYYFYYGTTGCTTRFPASGFINSGEVITGLAPNTTYFVCAVGQNNAGTARGNPVTFKTPGIPPVVVTGPETSVTLNSAVLNGTVDANGAATTYSYRYGTVTKGTCASLTSATAAMTAGSATTPVSKPHLVTNLLPNTTYYYCLVGSNAFGVSYGAVATLKTAAVAAQPVLTITANGGLGTVTVTKGTSVTIRATFVPDVGDTLTGTAINGPAPYTYALRPANFNWIAAPGISTAPNSPETYTFTANTPGDFTFIPAAITTQHPSPWYDGGKFVTVHVSCPAGQVQSGSNCVPSCSAGSQLVNGVCQPICSAGQQVMNGVCVPTPTCSAGQVAVNGVCVNAAGVCSAGQVLVNGVCTTTNGGPTTNSNGCNPGEQLVNGVCVPIDLCSNMPGNQSTVPTHCHLDTTTGSQCLADPGYRVDAPNAACVPTGVISAFSATPNRIRPNDLVTLSWTVANMTSCTIAANNNAPASVANGDGSHSTVISNIQQITTYRLTCNDGVEDHAQSVVVNVIPVYQEL